jgi:hypothetical protein
MSEQILEDVFEIIKSEPHSSQALLLFGLIKTLDIDKGGHMYLLVKLQEMTAETRQLAYQLMELMAGGETVNDAWKQFVATIEETIRNG